MELSFLAEEQVNILVKEVKLAEQMVNINIFYTEKSIKIRLVEIEKKHFGY